MASKAHALFTESIDATATVAQKRMVDLTGAYATAAQYALGVAAYDAESGDRLSVHAIGSAVVTAGAAVAVGDALEVGSDGKVVTQSAGVTVGRALEAAAADGDLIEMLLITN